MSGILLHYPALGYYWYTYGTPEDPNAGSKAIMESIRAMSTWENPYSHESPSVGLFQQIPSSWSKAPGNLDQLDVKVPRPEES